MPYRLEKLNSLIKEELSKILQREIEFPPDVLVTVTKVDVSSDVTHAKIGISVLPDKKADYIINKLQKNIGLIQSLLNKRLVLHFVPKISFKIDKTAAKIDHFEKLAKTLEKE